MDKEGREKEECRRKQKEIINFSSDEMLENVQIEDSTV